MVVKKEPLARPGEPDPEPALPIQLPKGSLATPPPPDPESGIDKSEEIRKFRDFNVQEYIDSQIATLPPEAHGAVIVYGDMVGVKAAIVGKKELGPGELKWTVVAAKPYHGPLEATGGVAYSW
jgi:hypothetical protein